MNLKNYGINGLRKWRMKSQNDVEFYEIVPTEKFDGDIRFYIKKRKYTHIIKDIQDILDDLGKGVFKGDVIADLKLGTGDNTYKVRAINSNKKQGKSNGYRLIYYVETKERIVFLITIYHKKDDNRIPSDSEIADLIKEHCLNN